MTQNDYLFIEALFKQVLSFSTTIKGRFYICPKFGQEINSDNLDQIITDTVKKEERGKVPLTIMMPPISEDMITGDQGSWERFNIELLFLTTSFQENGQVKKPNSVTGTSQHRIMDDWQKMKNSARAFIIALLKVMVDKTPADLKFRVVDTKKMFDPISTIGNDAWSGVKLSFKIDVWNDCGHTDYPENFAEQIVIP